MFCVYTFAARGRPKRNAKDEESDSHDESKDTSSATETEESGKNEEVDAKSNDVAVENNAHEAKEESANNNAETTPKVVIEVLCSKGKINNCFFI